MAQRMQALSGQRGVAATTCQCLASGCAGSRPRNPPVGCVRQRLAGSDAGHGSSWFAGGDQMVDAAHDEGGWGGGRHGRRERHPPANTCGGVERTTRGRTRLHGRAGCAQARYGVELGRTSRTGTRSCPCRGWAAPNAPGAGPCHARGSWPRRLGRQPPRPASRSTRSCMPAAHEGRAWVSRRRNIVGA